MENSTKKSFKGSFIILIGVYVVMTVYFLAKRFIPTFDLSSLELIVFLCLVLILLIFIIVGIIKFLFRMGSKIHLQKNIVDGRFMINIIVIVLILGGFILSSQWTAHTPAIVDDHGDYVEGSIATLEKVKLGGVEQRLIIRGQDINKPVLLFLSGGPGASEAARVLRFNDELERLFVVVIWEQRGCGKSYPSINPKADLTIDQYVSDIIELTDILRSRFDEEKVYLVGHSWGTIIGVKATQQRPDLFHAYVGTAQMVDVEETDQIIYDAVIDYSLKNGDLSFVKTLQELGKPLYFGKSPIKPYSTLFGREYAIFEVPNIQNEEYRPDGDVMIVDVEATRVCMVG